VGSRGCGAPSVRFVVKSLNSLILVFFSGTYKVFILNRDFWNAIYTGDRVVCSSPMASFPEAEVWTHRHDRFSSRHLYVFDHQANLTYS
jgi:hypothetical protein